MNADWRTRYEVAVEAAKAAGQLALSYFDRGTAVELKHDSSPVTIADREAEQLLRKTLIGRFPQDGFLGEEFGDQPGSSGFRWIIDPIDGTRSFVRNVPVWATLIGLEYKGEAIAGIAVTPALGMTTYRALRGDGAFKNDRPIHVSDASTLRESVLFHSSLHWYAKAGRLDAFVKLAMASQRNRGFGDFYGFVLVAEGAGEIMIEHGVHVWDVAGLRVVVEEAGGRFTDWQDVPNHNCEDVIATNGRVHSQALAIMNGQ
jgi:histidinol-phosphatase